eukprot:6241720-Amphidinium_carterae.1
MGHWHYELPARVSTPLNRRSCAFDDCKSTEHVLTIQYTKTTLLLSVSNTGHLQVTPECALQVQSCTLH